MEVWKLDDKALMSLVPWPGVNFQLFAPENIVQVVMHLRFQFQSCFWQAFSVSGFLSWRRGKVIGLRKSTLLVSWKEALDSGDAGDDTDAIQCKEEWREEMKHLKPAFDWFSGCADGSVLKAFICDVSPQPLWTLSLEIVYSPDVESPNPNPPIATDESQPHKQ